MKFRISQPQAIHQIGSRPTQEDSIFPVLNAATTNDRLFILCDGMGGHESGEVASGTVCKTMSDYILSRMPADGVLEDQLLEEALSAAYAAVDAKDTHGLKKMGTTLTLLSMHKGGVTVAHIGDSRIYHLRPSTGEILYRSRDHSLVYDLFEVGELTFEELRTAKNKNVITRVIMANQERPSKADIVHITDVEPGDYFYLCSDGMLEQMDDDDLMAIFSSQKTDDEKRKLLTGETIDNSDNHSAYFIHIESVEREQGDNLLVSDEASFRAANKVFMAEREQQGATAMMPPAPPVADEVPVGEEEVVQVVAHEPEPPQAIPPQPQMHQAPPQYNQTAPLPPTKNSGGGGAMKWAIIGVLFIAVIAAAGILFFLLKGSDDKPAPQAQPQEINLPVKPTPAPSRQQDLDEDDYMQPSATTPSRPARTTTTTPARPANTSPSKINQSHIDQINTGGKHDDPNKPGKVKPNTQPQKPAPGKDSDTHINDPFTEPSDD